MLPRQSSLSYSFRSKTASTISPRSHQTPRDFSLWNLPPPDNRLQARFGSVSLIRESSMKPGAFVSHSLVYPRTVPGRVGERMNDFGVIF